MRGKTETFLPPGWLEPTLHASYLKWLLRYIGCSEAQISLKIKDRTDHFSYLEMHNLLQDFEYKLQLTDAANFGLNTSLAAHGFFGQAAVASANLNQAMSVIAKYKPTRNNVFSYDWTSLDEGGTFTMIPRFDLREYWQTSSTATLINLVQICIFLCGTEIIPRIELAAPWDLAASPSVQKIDGIQLKKSNHVNSVSLTLPMDVLQRKNIFADTRQFSLACRGSEEELQIFRGRFTERVRSLIAVTEVDPEGEGKLNWLALNDVCRKLAMSPRTLNRRLKDENTSYGQILEQTRSELACWYLKNTTLSISQISAILGYSNDTNFSRTFKGWKHALPSAYRVS